MSLALGRMPVTDEATVYMYDSIQDLTYVWRTKCVKLKVSDFILKTTFSRVKLCVESKYDIKNAQL